MAPFTADPRQRAVLDHTDGPMLVTGGFGTGKTRVLRERFARLVEAGADPERVALVLGSRRARDEARRALLERLALPLPNLTIVTIHGLAHHVVGQRYAQLAYSAPPQLLDASNQSRLVRELLEGEDPALWPAYGRLLHLRGFADEVRQFVIRAQEALLPPDEIEERARATGLHGWIELAAFLRRYLAVLDTAGQVDFAGLVEQAAAAVGSGPALFDHVLIDDHQDSTFAAERLLAELGPRSLVVAGDLGAHVFSFQGTTDEPLRRFEDRNPGAPHVHLETPHRPRPETIDAWRASHVSEQHASVARELRRIHVEEHVPWDGLAVVIRRHGPHEAGLLRALDDARIPRTSVEWSPGTRLAAARPFELALRWLVANADERDALVEPVLTSELGRLSPASARALLRLVRAYGHPPREALDLAELAAPDEAASLVHLADVLRRAEQARSSVLDAFGVLWRELPFAAELVRNAEADPRARIDLDAVMELFDAITDASAGADPTVDAFVPSFGSPEGVEGFGTGGEERPDAVHVLTAHACVGREVDTVVVLDVVEGDFPSLSRPEPMFDLNALEGGRGRSETNRRRLADERRLFALVCARARRRVVLTATDPHADHGGVTLTSRFVEEMGAAWRDAPAPPFQEPVSIAEAAAAWRRILADGSADRLERIGALDGLVALGEDAGRWWFQHDWTDGPEPRSEDLYLSYSRLDTLENCELQYVLASELGLDPGGGYQAWVGRLVHSIIEDCERGLVERTRIGFDRALDDRWEAARFPSHAVSEAERAHAHDVLIPNWFSRYADPPATSTEGSFAFEFEGARIRGKIDRIGPVPEGETRITDYKTGRGDNAPKPAESLQLGIYYLAVNECEDLAPHRPVHAVELAFLGGRKADPALEVKAWSVSEDGEEDYKARMRERVSGLIARIRDLDRERRYVADTKANCFFCRFQTLCSRYPQGGPVFAIEEREPSEAGRR